jgi:uncharacterized protein (TIGR04141 family)
MAKRKNGQAHHRLSVYLLKDTIETPNDAVRSGLGLEVIDLANAKASLYVQPAITKSPRWARLFDAIVDSKKLGIRSSSAAAALIVPAADRHFAVTFGFGRHLLRPGVWDERFGLKVTLNAIDSKSIRSIDRQTFESLGRHVQEQTNRPAEATDFGLNVEQDMLRAVTGAPKDAAFASRLHGKDSLVANVNFGLEGLVSFLERCNGLAHDDSYKTEYPWVDHISEVTDARLRDRLDLQLVQRIRDRNFDQLWLAVPERIDWGEVDGFKFSESKKVSTSLDLQFSDLLKQLHDPSAVTLSQLKNKHAVCFAHDHEQAIHKWSAYQCVCFEVNEGDSTYLLSGGRWYRIATSFVQQVNNFVENMPVCKLTLPSCAGVNESEYNSNVCSAKGFLLLDQRLINYGGGHSKIEVCDFLTPQKQLVHVKKYGGSSVLSHLFSQGAVSGELLFTDPEFRAKANKLLPKSLHFSTANFRPSDYEVVFAIITWSTKNLTLPFFSRVSLRAAVRRLQGFGYKVTLLPVPGPRAIATN